MSVHLSMTSPISHFHKRCIISRNLFQFSVIMTDSILLLIQLLLICPLAKVEKRIFCERGANQNYDAVCNENRTRIRNLPNNNRRENLSIQLRYYNILLHRHYIFSRMYLSKCVILNYVAVYGEIWPTLPIFVFLENSLLIKSKCKLNLY